MKCKDVKYGVLFLLHWDTNKMFLGIRSWGEYSNLPVPRIVNGDVLQWSVSIDCIEEFMCQGDKIYTTEMGKSHRQKGRE